jgi:hypothetical protein
MWLLVKGHEDDERGELEIGFSYWAPHSHSLVSELQRVASFSSRNFALLRVTHISVAHVN